MTDKNESLVVVARRAWANHRAEAVAALKLYVSYCDPVPPPVPGMSTVIRLAVRIELGKSVEEAAAREYLYRWNLAVDRWRVFGAPHPLGM